MHSGLLNLCVGGRSIWLKLSAAFVQLDFVGDWGMRAGWQAKPFDDCIEKVTYTAKIQRKDFLNQGEFPIVSQEESFINGYWNNAADVFSVTTPIVIFGDHTKVLKYIDFDFVLGADGVKLLPPKPFLLPRFFYHQLRSVNLDSLGYARHYKLLRELEIRYPPLPEQQRIVTLLDEAFDGIATAKAHAEKNLQNARAIFESHLQAVFTQRGEGWDERTLGEIYDVRDGTHDSPKYHDKGFPLVTSKNLKRDGLSFDDVRLIDASDYRKINERSAVHKGDVLLAMIGTIGNPVVVEMEPDFAIKNVALLKVPVEQNSHFLRYYLSSQFVVNKMQSEAKGTTQKFVGLGYLRSFPIIVPSGAKQAAIVYALDDLSTETNRLEEIYKQKSIALDELKKSLLHRAFSGQL
jgi:type I restriction enzyme S subunit